jgi:hypothetical protein
VIAYVGVLRPSVYDSGGNVSEHHDCGSRSVAALCHRGRCRGYLSGVGAIIWLCGGLLSKSDKTGRVGIQ